MAKKVGDTIEVGNRTYKVAISSPHTVRAEAEKLILATMRDPLVVYKQQVAAVERSGMKLETWEKQHMLNRAMDMSVSPSITDNDVAKWMATADGMAFQFYVLVRELQPDVTLAVAKSVIAELGKEQIKKMLDDMGSDETEAEKDVIAEQIKAQMTDSEEAAADLATAS